MTTIEPTPGPWEDNGNGLIPRPMLGEDDEAPFVADVCSDPPATCARARERPADHTPPRITRGVPDDR